MKMLITLESHNIFCSKSAYLYMYCTFERCLETGVQNGDEALPSISPAGRGQMLITLEPHGIF